MGTRGAYELRQRTAALLERVVVEAAGELADDAARLLDDLRAVWVRERRWRNDGRQLASVEHVAGAVIDCREDRSWCPGYIVDRRQTCARCGAVLVHGRWSLFFAPGDLVAQRLGDTPIYTAPDGTETPCAG